MYAHRLLAVLLATAGAVRASPTPVAAAARADTTSSTTYNTDAWITVGTDSIAKTVTPALTTISGVPTVVDATPTTSGTVTTTSQPKATNKNGAGSFPVCNNRNGTLAPFCAPSDRGNLTAGETYYITWDPKYFSFYPNATVILTGNYYNESIGNATTQAFQSNTLAAASSYYAWTVSKSLLSGYSSKGVNISISMSYLSGRNTTTRVQGPIVRVAKKEPYRQKPAELPDGAGLYIGLPAVLLFCVVMVLGTCYYNKHHRHINIASIRPRSRFNRNGYGIGRSRRQRTAAADLDSKNAFLLQDRGGGSGGSSSHDDDDDDYDDYGMSQTAPYRDTPTEAEERHQNEYNKRQERTPLSLDLSDDDWAAPERPRRDSDALDSLAGTPTEEHFSSETRRRTNQGGGSSGNAFRDELRRQNENLI